MTKESVHQNFKREFSRIASIDGIIGGPIAEFNGWVSPDFGVNNANLSQKVYDIYAVNTVVGTALSEAVLKQAALTMPQMTLEVKERALDLGKWGRMSGFGMHDYLHQQAIEERYGPIGHRVEQFVTLMHCVDALLSKKPYRDDELKMDKVLAEGTIWNGIDILRNNITTGDFDAAKEAARQLASQVYTPQGNAYPDNRSALSQAVSRQLADNFEDYLLKASQIVSVVPADMLCKVTKRNPELYTGTPPGRILDAQFDGLYVDKIMDASKLGRTIRRLIYFADTEGRQAVQIGFDDKSSMDFKIGDRYLDVGGTARPFYADIKFGLIRESQTLCRLEGQPITAIRRSLDRHLSIFPDFVDFKVGVSGYGLRIVSTQPKSGALFGTPVIAGLLTPNTATAKPVELYVRQ